MALSTIKRRSSSFSGFYAYLIAVGELGRSPVLPGLATRASVRRGGRAEGVIRPVRLLPRVLDPDKVTVLSQALHKWRDRAMVEAMRRTR
jgi:hypothetical protein